MASKESDIPRRENTWLNLGFNILIPSLLLIKGKKIFEMMFAELPANIDVIIFVLALAFPIVYGVYDLIKRRKWNIFSIVGVLSVALTAGIGLMRISREWIIIKEGIVPLILGAVVLATAYWGKPLAKIIFMNESLVNLPKIDAALDERGTRADFDSALRRATYWLAASFLLSSILNFALASYIFKSEAGTEAFNEEVGRMTALSFPVILLPTMIILIIAMVRLFSEMTKCTGLSIEEYMIQQDNKK